MKETMEDGNKSMTEGAPSFLSTSRCVFKKIHTVFQLFALYISNWLARTIYIDSARSQNNGSIKLLKSQDTKHETKNR